MTHTELLFTIACEECAEVIQAALAAHNFGLKNVKPGHHMTKEQELVLEINDVYAVYEMLESRSVVPVGILTDDSIQSKACLYHRSRTERGLLLMASRRFAEASQFGSKCLRFGPSEKSYKSRESNVALFSKRLVEAFSIVRVMEMEGLFSSNPVLNRSSIDQKKQKVLNSMLPAEPFTQAPMQSLAMAGVL